MQILTRDPVQTLMVIAAAVALLANLWKLYESRFVPRLVAWLRNGFHNYLLLTGDFLELRLIDALAATFRLLIRVIGLGGGIITLALGHFRQPWPVCIASAAFLIVGGLFFSRPSNW